MCSHAASKHAWESMRFAQERAPGGMLQQGGRSAAMQGRQPGRGQWGRVGDCVISPSQIGYGRWDDLRAEVRQSWVFRFDWFIKTRTALELAHRVDVLAHLIELELEEEEAAEAAEARRKKGKGAAVKPGVKRPMEESMAPPSKRRK